jgi:transaldolase
LAVTGLTSNPTIFDHAIRHGTDYDAEIRDKLKQARSPEELFLALALTDLRQAADLFRPSHDRTNGVDGWVSLELSPLLAYDTAKSIAQAKRLHAEAGRPNFFIKIPGTPEGVPAIEESIFAGVPINVTLLFSREQYLAVAEAYLRGIERRLAAGQNPQVWSVASLFISRWDKAVLGKAPEALRDQLGIAIARRTYKAYRELLDSPRQRQRELYASRKQSLTRLLLEMLYGLLQIPAHEFRLPIDPVQGARHHVLLRRVDRPGEGKSPIGHPIRPHPRPRRRPPRCLHHLVGHPAKEEGIGSGDVLDRVTMQFFVRENCAMIAAPIQCDVAGIPKGLHYVKICRPRSLASPVGRNGAAFFDLDASAQQAVHEPGETLTGSKAFGPHG